MGLLSDTAGLFHGMVAVALGRRKATAKATVQLFNKYTAFSVFQALFYISGSQLGWFCPPRPLGHLEASQDIFGCHNWEEAAANIWFVETEDSTKHAKMHRTTLTAENYQAWNVDNAKVEKLCFK